MVNSIYDYQCPMLSARINNSPTTSSRKQMRVLLIASPPLLIETHVTVTITEQLSVGRRKKES